MKRSTSNSSNRYDRRGSGGGGSGGSGRGGAGAGGGGGGDGSNYYNYNNNNQNKRSRTNSYYNNNYNNNSNTNNNNNNNNKNHNNSFVNNNSFNNRNNYENNSRSRSGSGSGANNSYRENAETSFTNDLNNFCRSSNNKDSLPDKEFSSMSRNLWSYFQQNQQTYDCWVKKHQLKDALYHIFKNTFPYLGVYIVGSSANGFGANQSDVDICLMVSSKEINQKTEAIYLLRLLAKALRKAVFIKNLMVISAKVPIIKFHDSHNDIDCDVNLNNHIGIRNTHLMRSYSDQDWRTRPLVLNIKRWAKYHNINDASQQTLTSYSLTLMTIFYLQTVCNPPVLPVLQKLYPDKFKIDIPVDELRLTEDLPTFTSRNNQTLGELFYGFIEYYSNFNFENNIISVRTGRLLSLDVLPYDDVSGHYSQWKYVLIEEPFDGSNTARSVFDGFIFRKILHVFRTSLSKLRHNKDMNVLFREPFYEPYYSNDYKDNSNDYNDDYYND